jgi:two-component system nitrogen regulation response regulator GlnG
MARLKAYDWPGNVRELENLVRRLTVLYAQDTIGPEVIDAELREGAPVRHARSDSDRGDGFMDDVARYVGRIFAERNGRLPPGGLYGRILREVERPLIARVLSETRGNQLRAAALLGVNRNTLRKKIRELDIEVMRAPR